MYTYPLESQWQSMFLSIQILKEPKWYPFSIQELQKTSWTLTMQNG